VWSHARGRSFVTGWTAGGAGHGLSKERSAIGSKGVSLGVSFGSLSTLSFLRVHLVCLAQLTPKVLYSWGCASIFRLHLEPIPI